MDAFNIFNIVMDDWMICSLQCREFIGCKIEYTNCFNVKLLKLFDTLCPCMVTLEIDCLCRNDRYDDLRVCLGEGLLQKLKEQRIFMVSIKWTC